MVAIPAFASAVQLMLSAAIAGIASVESVDATLTIVAISSLVSTGARPIIAVPDTVIIGSRISELEHDALRQLKKAKPQLLAIDEIHHLLACTPREQRTALNVVKFLSNELRVSIIALGTSEALHVMRTDPQIASRFESCALPSWTANEQLRSFVAGFLQQIDIQSGDLVNNQVAMDYLLELTSGVTGRIVKILRLGARCALRRDSRILSIGCLQDAGQEFAADLGSERNVSN
jgi:hypothetical protein